jgi:hypothetical protein
VFLNSSYNFIGFVDLFVTYFTELCRVQVAKQVSKNAPHFTGSIRNLFDN